MAETFGQMAKFDGDLAQLVVQGAVDLPEGPLRVLAEEAMRPEGLDFSPEQRLIHRRLKIEAASKLAPYLFPQLSRREVVGKVTLTHEEALRELE